MEVTRSNFSDVLEELEDDISSSQFLAIDGEFTGLHKGQDFNAFDTPSQYYAKLRSGGMDFLLVQLGLCAFKYNKNTGKFTHKAYNFYVFPRPFSRSAPDPRFLCQSSSLDFLISQGFDFNKLFREGIPYLTEVEEKRLREQLEEKQKARSNNNSKNDDSAATAIPIPEEHVALIEDVCTRIKTFLESDETDDELILDGYNAFVRKLIYQTVADRFDSRTFDIETRVVDNHNRVLVVSRALNDEARKRKEEEKQGLEKHELDSAVGVSYVIRMISQSGKLIIGHNMLLDLCHILHQFCTPLPESYREFKDLAKFMFPRVIDTKYMSCNGPFKDLISSTVLGHLHKTLSEEPFDLVHVAPAEEGKGYASTEEKAHEAGYDAYLTGVCFLTLANYLGSSETPPKTPVLPNSPLLRPYINKLHLMRVQDVTFIDLNGEDEEPSRDHVFYVTFPKEWKTYDLTQLFSPFGAVIVSWLTDNSAYVGLYRRDQAQLVLKTLTQSDTYSVERYSDHMKKLQRKQERPCRCHLLPVTQPASPSLVIASQQRKKRSLELQMSSDGKSHARKRSRVFGEFGSRSIEPIPEEDAETEESLNGGGSVAAVKATVTKAKKPKVKRGATAVFCEKVFGTEAKKKEFEEDDSWE